jgi:hypothetical protein
MLARLATQIEIRKRTVKPNDPSQSQINSSPSDEPTSFPPLFQVLANTCQVPSILRGDEREE